MSPTTVRQHKEVKVNMLVWRQAENCQRPTWELWSGLCLIGGVVQYWANSFRTVYYPKLGTGHEETLEAAKEWVVNTYLNYHGIAPNDVVKIGG